MQNADLAEVVDIVVGFAPVNMATAANTGAWVSVKNATKLTAVLSKGAGTAGEDPTITLQQAKDSSGTGAKALNFTRIYERLGTATEYTRVDQTAANTYVNAASAEVAGIIQVSVDVHSLDVDNGFCYVRATIADVGAGAQIGGLNYHLSGLGYQGNPLP